MSYTTSDDAPLRTGAAVGVAAFVVGLVLTFLLGSLDLTSRLGRLVGTFPVRGTIAAFLWFHLWPLLLGGSMAGLLVWTVVPVGLLTAAGYVTAASAASRMSNGFKNGASVTAGYLGLTVVAFLLLAVTGGGGAVGESGTLIVGVVSTGIVFPVVFGGLGGAIADGT